jgi:dTDP-4-dehydrorhamnose reductase
MSRVWVLGANGMLGSRVSLALSESKINFSEITRAHFRTHQLGSSQIGDIESLRSLIKIYGNPTHIVNAIGVVKPRIDEGKIDSVIAAIHGNTLFPIHLGKFCETNGVHLIQIATDCVYSGIKGKYVESDPHDPSDVYGMTKSLGEFSSENLSLIRCSIIGLELQNKYSLVEWVNSQPLGASINGFTNHNWNGVTTKVFGMIVAGIVKNKVDPLGKFHLIPKDKVSKFQLVNLIKEEIGRHDLSVKEFNARDIIDRTLSSELMNQNTLAWEKSGFLAPPTISEMIKLGL